MPFNPFNQNHRRRLDESAREAVEDVRTLRQTRIRLMRQYVGMSYGERGAPKQLPVNIIQQQVDTYVAQLSPRRPKAMVESKHDSLRLRAHNLQLALDHLMGEIRLGDTAQLGVTDAMFGPSIVKIGIMPGQAGGMGGGIDSEPRGHLNDPGQPFVDRVSPDDFLWDTKAVDWRYCDWMADRWPTPVDDLLTLEGIDAEAVQRARRARAGHGSYTPSETGDRAEEIARSPHYGESFEDEVWVWDVWFPQAGIVCKFVDSGAEASSPFGELLGVFPWAGPENGPYRILQLKQGVPDNAVFPLPPTLTVEPLHALTNLVWRKLTKQAERMKVNFIGQGDPDEAKRMASAADGQVLLTQDGANLDAVRWDGPDNNMLGFGIQSRQLASIMAGNLDALAGLGSQTDTARGDAMIQASANKQMEFMRNQVNDWMGGIIADLAWHLFYNPEIEVPIVKTIPGSNIRVESSYSAMDREGDFLEYNFSIHPHSQGDRSPESMLADINTILQGMILPLMPNITEQGGRIRTDLLIREVARLKNLPFLDQLVEYAEDIRQPVPGPVANSPARPPVQVRVNERVSRPGASARGQENTMSQLLAGGKPQPSEVRQISGAGV